MKIYSFSLTPKDKKFIDREAAKMGLTSSAWLRLMIRSCASGQSAITPPTVEDFVNLYRNNKWMKKHTIPLTIRGKRWSFYYAENIYSVRLCRLPKPRSSPWHFISKRDANPRHEGMVWLAIPKSRKAVWNASTGLEARMELQRRPNLDMGLRRQHPDAHNALLIINQTYNKKKG